MKRASKFASLYTMILAAVFLIPIILTGCSSYTITFYPHEEWKLEASFDFSDAKDKETIRTAIETELKIKADEWKNRGIQFEWHQDKDTSSKYWVTAEGQGWHLLNASLFGGQAVIQAGQNPDEISISCDCIDALLRLPQNPILREDDNVISLNPRGRKILAHNGTAIRSDTEEAAYWNWSLDRGRLDPGKKSSGRVEVQLTEFPKPTFFSSPLNLIAVICGGILALSGVLGLLVWRKRISLPKQSLIALTRVLLGLGLCVGGAFGLTACYLGSLATAYRSIFGGLFAILGTAADSLAVGLVGGILVFLDAYLLRRILGTRPSSSASLRRWVVYTLNFIVGFGIAFLTLFAFGGLKDSVFELFSSRVVPWGLGWGISVPAVLLALYATFVVGIFEFLDRRKLGQSVDQNTSSAMTTSIERFVNGVAAAMVVLIIAAFVMVPMGRSVPTPSVPTFFDVGDFRYQGEAAAKKGDYDQAIEYFTKAIELDPRDNDRMNAYSYLERGDAYYQKGSYDQAIADYNKLLELYTGFQAAYHFRGKAYQKKGSLELAITDFNKAIELDPKYAEYYRDRGVAYRQQGLGPQALSDFQIYLTLSPKASDRAQVEQWIAELK